ncbi:hypothetical protein FDUTEX481_03462 [Tolypothrix sp. PCC 7601]|nr:hypothetical protein FDUTEX481_03462 [Tolypothrix sp. PCC 7601]
MVASSKRVSSRMPSGSDAAIQNLYCCIDILGATHNHIYVCELKDIF